jgi:PilZ domain
MELSARQFAEIVNHLKGPQRFGGRAPDQRRAPRVARQTRITIFPVGPAESRNGVGVQVKNLSSRGLGFVRDQKMRPGDQFVVRLPREDAAASSVEMLCTVIHCESVAKNTFSIGAEFTCVLPDKA